MCPSPCAQKKRLLPSVSKSLKYLARPGGFEPPAKSLEGSCSIHLSYERTVWFIRGKAGAVKSGKGGGMLFA